MKIPNVKVCNTIYNRFLGMMFQRKKTPVGYFFARCHSIHTFFCFFKIDVVLLDKNMKVLSIKYNLKPWRIYFFKCDSILEYGSGYIPEGIKENIEINFL